MEGRGFFVVKGTQTFHRGTPGPHQGHVVADNILYPYGFADFLHIRVVNLASHASMLANPRRSHTGREIIPNRRACHFIAERSVREAT